MNRRGFISSLAGVAALGEKRIQYFACESAIQPNREKVYARKVVTISGCSNPELNGTWEIVGKGRIPTQKLA